MHKVDEQVDAKNLVIKRLILHILRWNIKGKRLVDKNHYTVPLSTFWRPLDYLENIDTGYEKEEFRLDLVENTKKDIVEETITENFAEKISKAVEDIVVEEKFKRTHLGFYKKFYDDEDLVFEKLQPHTEKISNEILDVVPEKIRDTFRAV